MIVWRFLVCIYLLLSLVHGQDEGQDAELDEDYDEEKPVERMEKLADRALEFLNADHNDADDQMVNYMRGLRYLALALDIFDQEECLINECTPGTVSSALSTFGQAAEVHLDLAEFITRDVNKIESSLDFAKTFCERALEYVKAYEVGEEGESYFGQLLDRQRRVQEKFEEEVAAAMAAGEL